MATVTGIDPLRVVHDLAYARTLTPEQWRGLMNDPEWLTLAAEQPELVQSVLDQVGVSATVQPRPSTAPAAAFAVLGKAVPRVQGMGVVTGIGKYAEHMSMPGMLHMKVLRSPHPHAKIRSIDASKAEKMPGVVAVLHYFNQPKEYADVRLYSGPPFRYIFSQEVFEVGTPIVAVAAESEHLADEAIHQIVVDYEVLPAVLDPLEGMKPTTPKQWDNRLDGTIISIARPLVRGDPDNAFAQADVVVESVTEKATEQNSPLEPTVGLYWWENERLNMVWTSRWPHGHRSVMAQALKVDESRVRVVSPGYLGSSYGSHRDIDLTEVQAAILAKVTGRPIRHMNSRGEDLVDRTHRGMEHNEAKLGVKRDGTIVAATYKIIGDTGAMRRLSVASGSWSGLQNTYAIPNLRLEAIDVMTNRYKSGTFRCVSHPNGTFAQETLIDRAAYAIGMNPLDIRLRNLNEAGNPDSKRPYSNPGIRDCLLKAAEAIGWQQKWHQPRAREVRPGVFHGMGIAVHMCNHGAGGNPATGMVVINGDGTLTVISGAAEVGAGERTQMAMIAAEVLGIPFEKTSIAVQVDSDTTSDTGITAGSRQTNSGGWGVYQAAMDARRQLLEWASRKFEADARGAGGSGQAQTQIITEEGPETTASTQRASLVDQLDVKDGVVFFKSDPNKKLQISDVVAFATNPIIGRGAHIQDPRWERLAMAAAAAEVEVDTVTGAVKVTRYVAAHDVGQVINRQAIEQQIEGGVTMGISATLYEQMLVDQATGLPLNPNILDYKLASIKDVPERIDIILVEKPKEYGVFGAHGIGEPPIALPAPVITNAVYNAVGVWIDKMPITPAKVLAALKAAPSR